MAWSFWQIIYLLSDLWNTINLAHTCWSFKESLLCCLTEFWSIKSIVVFSSSKGFISPVNSCRKLTSCIGLIKIQGSSLSIFWTFYLGSSIGSIWNFFIIFLLSHFSISIWEVFSFFSILAEHFTQIISVYIYKIIDIILWVWTSFWCACLSCETFYFITFFFLELWCISRC